MTGMARTYTPWGPWEPMSPSEVAEIFARCPARWWIAGGYAIELAVGRPVREHGDIDVLLLRPDQLAVLRALPHWQWPGSRPAWQPPSLRTSRTAADQRARHLVPARPRPAMADPGHAGRILRQRLGVPARPAHPAANCQPRVTAADGIPYLAPDVQLLYKAKALRRTDELDFAAALTVLTDPQRQWLSHALSLVHGQEHPVACPSTSHHLGCASQLRRAGRDQCPASGNVRCCCHRQPASAISWTAEMRAATGNRGDSSASAAA